MLNLENFLTDLKSIVKFNSVKSAPKENAPFGTQTKLALDEFLKIAENFGFKTVNYDGYVGEITYGNGEEIGIIGHLDVVPTGLGWESDPFTLTVKDGKVYGRGVADDKGPCLMALYALNALKNSKIPCNKKFRLFIGTNEESGWEDVEYLKSKTTIPEYGFSPDGNFPVSYAEKGICIVNFKLPELKRFSNLAGGTVINAVCDYATVKAETSAIDKTLLEKYGLNLKDGNIIESKGVSAHGSTPQNGVNAFKNLFFYMLEQGEDVGEFTDFVFNDKLKISNLKNEQGNVTFSPDLITKDVLSCDMRIPAPFTKETVIPYLDKTGIPYTITEKHPPFMVDKNSELVVKLLKAYNEVTGENALPVHMGGSTFARVFDKGCAFGCEFEGYDFHMHEPNECMPLDLIVKAYDVLEKAIFLLAQ